MNRIEAVIQDEKVKNTGSGKQKVLLRCSTVKTLRLAQEQRGEKFEAGHLAQGSETIGGQAVPPILRQL